MASILRKKKKKKKNVVYTAAFLDLSGEEGEKIKDLISTLFNKKLEKQYFHHLTFKFKPTQKDIDITPFGKKVMLYVTALAEDDRAQALKVNYATEPDADNATVLPLAESHICDNEIPHITVATDGTTPPKYSNELLQLKTLPLSEAISIPATVGWWNGKEAVYTAP